MSTSMKVVVICLAVIGVGLVIYALVPKEQFAKYILYTLGAAGIVGSIAFGLDWGHRTNNGIG